MTSEQEAQVRELPPEGQLDPEALIATRQGLIIDTIQHFADIELILGKIARDNSRARKAFMAEGVWTNVKKSQPVDNGEQEKTSGVP